jgi:hypothetical protein
MTVGAALFFVILLVVTTLALRWVARHGRWRLAGVALAGLAALVALHDATLSVQYGHRASKDAALAGPPPPFSAADVQSWLGQGSPEPADGRWHAIRVAVAKASEEATSDPGLHDLRTSSRQLCVGNELAGVLAVGISDARSAMLEDLASQPCWAPGLLLFRHR